MILGWSLRIKFIAIATIILVIILNHNVLKAEQKLNNLDSSLLPLAKVHPLPTSLAHWDNKNNQEDYFTQIKPTPLGYLIWSQFPVKIYLAKPTESPDNSASNLRQQQWLEAVKKAIAEWNIYLPLQEIENPELADIIITRSTPERKVKYNPATRLYDIPRAITAQTSYQFYWQDHKILSHRMTIKVSPNLSQQAILAATRHELGHALGIWGHSPHQNDALYFSQVRDFPPISARDINTLKKIYQQPTRLGWIK
ncbi:MAG: peptidase [Xenococcaceae cyanobacterium MO_188.B32]|nr:peptidase [Xenococcaceae cyanobacterium MO_188.B32]